MATINLDSDDPALKPYIDALALATSVRDAARAASARDLEARREAQAEVQRLTQLLRNADLERESLLMRLRNTVRAASVDSYPDVNVAPDRSLRDALIDIKVPRE